MARLTIYKESHTDSTVVSNCFIDEYMKDANDAQLKVYLYLLRMLNANQATSVSDMADKFNHTEKDVLRALKYWEDKQLLSLDYDENCNLKGIRLRECGGNTEEPTAPAARISPVSTIASPAAHISPVGEMASAVCAAPQSTSDTVSASVGLSNTAVGMNNTAVGLSNAAVGLGNAAVADSDASGEAYVKPNYTPQQLRAFKESEDTAQLLFIAQTYIGKPLTPTEIKSILFIMDVLHFSDDLVDYLIQYCVDRGKKDFKYIEKVAINWAEQGITTPRQAQKLACKYDKNVYAIMNQLGKSGSPTTRELEYITRWTKEYGFSNDIIFEACERTVMATDKHRFEYADSILSSWKKEDVHRKSDIIRIDEMYQARRRNAAKAAANKFNQFTQNEYDFDLLERELLSN